MPYEYSLYPRDFQAQQLQHQRHSHSPRFSKSRHSTRSLNERIATIQRALSPVQLQQRHSSLREHPAREPSRTMGYAGDEDISDKLVPIDTEHTISVIGDDRSDFVEVPQVNIEEFQKRHNIPSTMPSSGRSTPVQRQSYRMSISTESDLLLTEEEVQQRDFTRRGIHIPSRTSSSNKTGMAMVRTSLPPHLAHIAIPASPESRLASSAASILSYETRASSVKTLHPLQVKGVPDNDHLEPLEEDDPRCFDLVAPVDDDVLKQYSLERRSELLFSREHLECIFDDPELLHRFTSFMSTHRPQSVPLLIYYLDALKALRAINYANVVAEALEPIPGHDFTEHPARQTVNSVLESKARKAFDQLVQEELPAYVTHTFIQVVTVSVQKRITGTMAPHLREASEGLAEVFCLTDVSRPDNPIVFASEEFHRTTQYGVSYAIGRNCRFLQGPRTDPHSVRRLRHAIEQQKEISEVFLNYRRDGSPFMNLLMMAPLFDSRGKLRYFIGAQVDVSGLVKDCTSLEGVHRLLAKQAAGIGDEDEPEEKKDEFQELCEMFNTAEVGVVKKYGGRMHHPQVDDTDEGVLGSQRPRLLIKDQAHDSAPNGYPKNAKLNGKLEGIYQHYLLVRPAPSFRILFTSSSLRVPGILQSPFLSRVGGSDRVRHELGNALASGRGVTAKIRWLASRSDTEGRPRWIHCTPLLGHNGQVGVWMIILMDDELHPTKSTHRMRMAPPVAEKISEKGQTRFPKLNGVQSKAELEANIDDSRPTTAVAIEDGSHRPISPANSIYIGEGSLNSFSL